jgi:hypothetical protein
MGLELNGSIESNRVGRSTWLGRDPDVAERDELSAIECRPEQRVTGRMSERRITVALAILAFEVGSRELVGRG